MEDGHCEYKNSNKQQQQQQQKQNGNNMNIGVDQQVGRNHINMKVMKMGYVEIFLRILGLLLTLVAAVVVGVDKETKVVSVDLLSTLPPVQLPVTAKWHYLSAFVYFLVSNAIASSYAGASLAYSLSTRQSKKNLALPLVIILDAIIMGLLLSANGAATAVGMIGLHGNSHVLWNKVCNVVSGFCRQFTAAVVLSMAGSVVFLLLVVIAIWNLHKRSK